MTTIPTTIPASLARSKFYPILEEVAKKLKRFTITRRGKPQAVVVHPDEVASWEETMDVLADSQLIKEIVKAEKELSVGKMLSEKKLVKELGLTEEDLG